MEGPETYTEFDLESLRRIANTERLAGDYVLAQTIEQSLLRYADFLGQTQIYTSNFGEPGSSRVAGC